MASTPLGLGVGVNRVLLWKFKWTQGENSRDTPSTKAEHGDDVHTLEVIPVQTEENSPGHADQSREPTTQFSNAIIQFDPDESTAVQERVMLDLVLANFVPNAMMGVDDSLTIGEEMLYVLDHNRAGTRSGQDKPLQTVNANPLLSPPLTGVVTRAGTRSGQVRVLIQKPNPITFLMGMHIFRVDFLVVLLVYLMKEAAAHQHQFILHVALDIVQDLTWTTSAIMEYIHDGNLGSHKNGIRVVMNEDIESAHPMDKNGKQYVLPNIEYQQVRKWVLTHSSENAEWEEKYQVYLQSQKSRGPRFQVEFTDDGQATGQYLAKHATIVGQVARTHCPPMYKDWAEVLELTKDALWKNVLEEIDLPLIRKECTLRKLNTTWKQKKYELRQVYDKFPTDAERKRNVHVKVIGRDRRGRVRGLGGGVTKTVYHASAPYKEIAQREKRACESSESGYEAVMARLDEADKARKILENEVADLKRQSSGLGNASQGKYFTLESGLSILHRFFHLVHTREEKQKKPKKRLAPFHGLFLFVQSIPPVGRMQPNSTSTRSGKETSHKDSKCPSKPTTSRSTAVAPRSVPSIQEPPRQRTNWVRRNPTITATQDIVVPPLNRDGVLLLCVLDSRLSKDLPSDLQKLQCKNKTNGAEATPVPLEHLKALHLKEATPKVLEELKSLILGRHQLM
ncbi:hypothetical protein IFM89_039286 [Coptis chinensis]|uniref:Uncharacterized protein n=1 Tax=Coptis chinensis TaxID=261450 RepID=A0A835IJ12_9MAGN|nr:hypothetical protein IFM89_039286 [Coptis chinensis]